MTRHAARTPRSLWSALLLAVFGPVLLPIPGAVALAQTSSPAPARDGQRAAIMALAEEALARLEESRKWDEKLKTQQLDSPRQAAVEQAKSTAEVARIALMEYQEGTLSAQILAAESDIKLAESEFVRAKDRLLWVKGMIEKGAMFPGQKSSEELRVRKTEFSLQEARKKLMVLKQYTGEKEIRQRKRAIETSESALREAEKQLASERSEHADLERRAAEAALLDDEIHAIARLDEAIRLRERDHLDRAEETLDEARRLWQAATATRLDRHYAKLKRRIAEVAEELGKGAEVTP